MKLGKTKEFLLIVVSSILIIYSFFSVYESFTNAGNNTIKVSPSSSNIRPDSLYGEELKRFEIFFDGTTNGHLPRNKNILIIGYNRDAKKRSEYLDLRLEEYLKNTENIEVVVVSSQKSGDFGGIRVFLYEPETLALEYGITKKIDFLILVDVGNRIRYFSFYFNEDNDVRLLLERFKKDIQQ